MTRIWAIYRAPHGAPAAFLVQAWDLDPGKRPIGGPLTNAATLELARETFPRAGLEAHAPRPVPGEPKNLVETWEPKR